MYKKYLSLALVFILVLLTGVFQASAYSKGDANLDEDVNIKDATLIQKYLAGLSNFDEAQIFLADVDGLKGVNIKDATHLQKWLAGVVDTLYGDEEITESTRNPDDPIELPFIPVK